jgi:beta-glucosidase
MHSIAVTGPRANEVLIDIYGGQYPYAVTPLEGIKKKVGPATTARYTATNEDDAAVTAAKNSDIALGVVGNHPICGAKLSGEIFNPDTSTKPCADPSEGREHRDRESIELSQERLIQQVYAANRKTIVMLVSSFPYAIQWTEQNVPAILHIVHASQEEGNALADVLFGDYTPAGV